MKLVVGTRGSKLSLIQTKEVLDRLMENFPDIEFDVKIIKTKGDLDLETPLYKIPQKGIFEREIDLALLKHDIDFAVHSMKDYPTKTFDDIVIAAVPPRRSPYDVFVSNIAKNIEDLPDKSRIGTSSLRREAFVKFVRKDLEVFPIRGNVESRLKKMREGVVDGLILAEVAIERLNEEVNYQRLNIEDFTPAAGQGALAVVARKQDDEILKILRSIDDEKSRFEVLMEREIISMLDVGCKTPLGVYVNLNLDRVNVIVSTVSIDYQRKVLINESVSGHDISQVTSYVVKVFREKGGERVLKEWRLNKLSERR
ncbi:MAG: hydroxymethylbilane synthase [Nitrososphaerota archaeon]|nr:hydroxymethylbilane synthase [Nitrososphaerales archaeon]MCX8191824.1 hydroxymethylbilane synthase [Nitrososphaerales archaeon]MDW8045598.1 hydroxymethylbilane synthase [Nitrososphaerota archaeon]